MSDPVSSMDVEDVLSSIRRLVSEEAKGNPVADESPSDADQGAAPQEDGALSDIIHAVEDGGSGGSAYSANSPPSNEVVEDSGASLDLGEDDTADDAISFRHKAPNSLSGDTDQKLVLTAAFRVENPDESDEEASNADTTHSDDAGDDENQDSTGHPHLRPVADSFDDNASGGFAGSGAAKLRQLDGAPEDTLFDRAREAMEAGQGGSTVETSFKDEPMVSNLHQEPEDGEQAQDAPDESENTPHAEPETGSDAPEDTAEDEVDTQPQTEDASTINFAEEETSVLDEDGLRDLISDMVREELQGELGDRITRNVRKLVRREIQRALASREFE